MVHLRQPLLLLSLAVAVAAQGPLPVPVLPVKPLYVPQAGLEPSVGGTSWPVRCGDFNGDGRPDLAVGAEDGVVYVEVGLGGGDFGPVVPGPVPTNRSEISDTAWGDVDGDGDLDVLAVRYEPADTHLYVNDGRAGLTDATAASFGALPLVGKFVSVALADLDGDGDLDAVMGCNGPVRLFWNDGLGHFTEDSTRITAIQQATYRLVVVDLNGDGHLDIVAANGGWMAAEPNRVFSNDGQGRFHFVTDLPGGAYASFSVAAGDIDGDGDLDLVVANAVVPDVLLRNDGGVFTDVSARLTFNPAETTWNCLIADIDHDGRNDVLLGGSGRVSLHHNEGGGRLRLMGGEELPSARVGNVRSLVVADFDGDGDDDLFLGHFAAFIRNDLFFSARTQLTSKGSATIGSSVELRAFGFAHGWTILAAAATRVATPTVWGTLWLDPATLVVDPSPLSLDGFGMGKRSLSIPNQASLRGRSLHLQGFHVSASPPWSRLMNYHRIAIQ